MPEAMGRGAAPPPRKGRYFRQIELLHDPRGPGAHRGLNNPVTWIVTQPHRKSIDD